MKPISAFIAQPYRIPQQVVGHATEIDFSNPLDVDASHDIVQSGLTSILSATTYTVPDKTFEAVAPDTSILVGLGVVLLISIAAGFVWNNDVVPISRTKLALSKRDGEVKQYLDELKSSSNSTIDESDEGEQNDYDPSLQVNERGFERWLFSDWLTDNKSEGKPGRKKEPALPILKSAKWNSGDNPIVVTSALLLVGILVASVTEYARF